MGWLITMWEFRYFLKLDGLKRMGSEMVFDLSLLDISTVLSSKVFAY